VLIKVVVRIELCEYRVVCKVGTSHRGDVVVDKVKVEVKKEVAAAADDDEDEDEIPLVSYETAALSVVCQSSVNHLSVI